MTDTPITVARLTHLATRIAEHWLRKPQQESGARSNALKAAVLQACDLLEGRAHVNPDLLRLIGAARAACRT